MGRRLLVVSACALVCAGSTHGAPPVAWVKTDQLVRASDGTELATTLYTPGTVTGPPPAGWPAIIMFHGLGGTRASMNAIAEQTFVREGYVVLTADHRGHGESGGLFDADGPREIEDARDLFDWLASRPDIDRSHIGAWGISLGGGVVWGALAAGVPFVAAEVYESWVDLFEALAPNKLPKSGAILGFLDSVPSERLSPELDAIKGQVGNGADVAALRRYADARSVGGSLGKIETPLLVFQGRRDFAFGLEQGIRAFRQLAGQRELYIGDFGHAPSSFPGPDIAVVFARAIDWFNRFLKLQPPPASTAVELSPDPYREGRNASFSRLPATTTVRSETRTVHQTIRAHGKVVLTFALPRRKLEAFGAPVVTVRASTRTKARQLVAVLEAVRRDGSATIVSEGGTLLPTSSKRWTLSFPLIHDTALIPRGAKLRLTLGWTSTAQSRANLLYLAGVPDGSSLTITSAAVKLPALEKPIS